MKKFFEFSMKPSWSPVDVFVLLNLVIWLKNSFWVVPIMIGWFILITLFGLISQKGESK
jgi:hypothetical protein